MLGGFTKCRTNAVPPIMAKAIAEKLADQLEQIEKRYER